MNLVIDACRKGSALFEKKLALIILSFFLTHLLNESTISIDNCFNTRSETFTWPNQIILIYFEHCSNYVELLRLYNFMEWLSDLPLDYAPYVVVKLVQAWRINRPYVWGDIFVEIVTHIFLSLFGLIRLCNVLLIFLYSRSLSKTLEPSPTPPDSQKHWLLSLDERSEEERHLPSCLRLPVLDYFGYLSN